MSRPSSDRASTRRLSSAARYEPSITELTNSTRSSTGLTMPPILSHPAARRARYMYASGGGHAEASAHRPLPPRLQACSRYFSPRLSRPAVYRHELRGFLYLCLHFRYHTSPGDPFLCPFFIRPRARTIGHGKTQPAGRGIVTAYADALGKHGILYQLAYMRPAEQRLI